MQTKKIDFLSQDYFDLVSTHPELADAFALGEQVIALSGGEAYEVVPNNSNPVIVNTPTPTTSGPETTTSTPVSPTTPIQTPTQIPLTTSKGPCAAGILPIFLLPIPVIVLKKRYRSK
jgi:hypothetical protein